MNKLGTLYKSIHGAPTVLFDSFLEKILQLELATLSHSSSKVARSIDLDLKKILPTSEF